MAIIFIQTQKIQNRRVMAERQVIAAQLLPCIKAEHDGFWQCILGE